MCDFGKATVPGSIVLRGPPSPTALAGLIKRATRPRTLIDCIVIIGQAGKRQVIFSALFCAAFPSEGVTEIENMLPVLKQCRRRSPRVRLLDDLEADSVTEIFADGTANCVIDVLSNYDGHRR
jgi:hypothetical protein